MVSLNQKKNSNRFCNSLENKKLFYVILLLKNRLRNPALDQIKVYLHGETSQASF